MAGSSSIRRTDDVFPSFRGEDVRDGFLSHLLKALDNKSIRTFRDNGIERSLPIGPELLSAIREAKISVVIFSKNYASSKWCLDELVEIHVNYMKSCQKVIPIFYNVDPSEVRKQTGEFGKVFEETCQDKTEVQKQKWKQALTDVANLVGEHVKQGIDEARIVEKIANDVENKLIISPSNYSGGLVGIEAHIEAMNVAEIAGIAESLTSQASKLIDSRSNKDQKTEVKEKKRPTETKDIFWTENNNSANPLMVESQLLSLALLCSGFTDRKLEVQTLNADGS